jgi:hypothetical protein
MRSKPPQFKDEDIVVVIVHADIRVHGGQAA